MNVDVPNYVHRKNSSCMPNFLIIGAEKSGTTALWHYLNQHPQIYMSPVKEPQFFAYENQDINFRGPGPLSKSSLPVTQLSQYEALFSNACNQFKAVGEVSPSYLYSPLAPERIKSYIPDVKLIAILRNPVDRAYSRFMHLIRDEREKHTNFDEALQQEEWRIKNNWWPDFYYKRNGNYHQQLLRYYDLFDHNQIRVYIYEEFSADPVSTVQDIYDFLNVDNQFVPNTSLRPNTSGIPKNKLIHKLLRELNRLRPLIEPIVPETLKQQILSRAQHIRARNLSKPKLSADIRKRLKAFFKSDILELSTLIDRNLSVWLE